MTTDLRDEGERWSLDELRVRQLERLKELKLQAMRRGEEASMSRMVREALDAYFKK